MSQLATTGVCAVRSPAQLLMRSIVWFKVRAAAGSGCCLKKALMSSRAAGSQKDDSAPAMVVSPPEIVSFGYSSAQCCFRNAQARGRDAGSPRSRAKNDAVSWLRSFGVSA